MYFYCVVPVAPMRSLPSHKSEMVSQILFGEAVEIIETAPGGWAKITCNYDSYQGWITSSHITAVASPNPHQYKLTPEYISTVLVGNTDMQVPMGAHIPQDALALNSSKLIWNYQETITAETKNPEPDSIVNMARIFLNTPYLWGGKSVWGIDCSGLVQQVYKWHNITLPRDAWQQAEQGEALHFLMEARPGDLAFFDNEEGRITHVGILINAYSILHASGKVRIDPIDTEGILNTDTGTRSHKLRIIKRMY